MNTAATDSETPVTVIVLNYNSDAYLLQCLNALKAQSYPDFSVIVADNNSEDDSFTSARDSVEDGRFQFIPIGENTGFARGNNLMASKARTPLIALLNPDAVPDKDWLGTLVEAAEAHPDFDMFGSTQISLDDPKVLDGAGDNYLAYGVPWRGGFGHSIDKLPSTREVFSPCAAAALYRKDAFDSVGGFDERYFCYVEDVDLGFRLRLRGARCLQIADAVVHHAGGVSSAGDNYYFSIFHGTRNMIWTFVKNMPGPLFWPLLPVHIAILIVLLLRAGLRRRIRPTVSGIAAAVAGLSDIWVSRRRVQNSRSIPIKAVASVLCWSVFPFLNRAPHTLRNSTLVNDNAA